MWSILGQTKFKKVLPNLYMFMPPKFGEINYLTSSVLKIDKIEIDRHSLIIELSAPEDFDQNYLDANVVDYIEVTIADVCLDGDLIKFPGKKYKAELWQHQLCEEIIKRLENKRSTVEIEVEF